MYKPSLARRSSVVNHSDMCILSCVKKALTDIMSFRFQGEHQFSPTDPLASWRMLFADNTSAFLKAGEQLHFRLGQKKAVSKLSADVSIYVLKTYFIQVITMHFVKLYESGKKLLCFENNIFSDIALRKEEQLQAGAI